MTDLISSAAQLLDLSLKAGADAASATASWNDGIEASARDGVIEEVGRSESLDIGVRVLVGQKQACVSASSAKDSALAELAERAVAMAREAPDDPFCGLADPAEIATQFPDLDLFDPAKTTADALREAALAADAAARDVSGIDKTDSSSASWSRRRGALVMSNGFSVERAGTFWGTSCTAIAGSGLGMERDYAWTAARHRADLRSPEDVGKEAGERTRSRLNPRKAKTCEVPVIYDQRLASSLLGHFLGAVNGASVARGSSFLKDSLGEQVFGADILITDDPHRIRGTASRVFDGEGLPTQTLNLVEDGLLKSWLTDLSSARQLDLVSTGSASFSIGSAPRPTSSNVTLSPGERSRDEMIRSLEEGFLIVDMLGASINATTGDYSRGASGFWIENGEIAYPVTEATVAGNLKEIFAALEPANDLPMDRSIASPSVLVTGLKISGE